MFDASTLILLARAELLDVFLDDYRELVLIPPAVERECVDRVSAPDAVLIRDRIQSGRIKVRKLRKGDAVTKLMADFRLGRGEAEALVLAQSRGADLVATDDRHAIRACKFLRIPFTTALGFVVRAAEKRLLVPEEAKLALERLVRFGRYSAAIVEHAEQRLRGNGHGESTEDT